MSRSNNCGAIDVKIDSMFIKNDLLRCRVFLLVLNWIGVLFVSRSFFLLRLREWDEWAGAPSCYLGMLNKLQKQVYRSINPASL